MIPLAQLSLESFNLHSASSKFNTAEKDFAKTLNYNMYSCLKCKTDIFRTEKGLRIKKRQKEAIKYILTTWREKSNNLITDKYIHKFAYRYQKRYSQRSQSIYKKKKYSAALEPSIAQLYTAYKILQAENRFAAFKRLA